MSSTTVVIIIGVVVLLLCSVSAVGAGGYYYTQNNKCNNDDECNKSNKSGQFCINNRCQYGCKENTHCEDNNQVCKNNKCVYPSEANGVGSNTMVGSSANELTTNQPTGAADATTIPFSEINEPCVIHGYEIAGWKKDPRSGASETQCVAPKNTSATEKCCNPDADYGCNADWVPSIFNKDATERWIGKCIPSMVPPHSSELQEGEYYAEICNPDLRLVIGTGISGGVTANIGALKITNNKTEVDRIKLIKVDGGWLISDKDGVNFAGINTDQRVPSSIDTVIGIGPRDQALTFTFHPKPFHNNYWNITFMYNGSLCTFTQYACAANSGLAVRTVSSPVDAVSVKFVPAPPLKQASGLEGDYYIQYGGNDCYLTNLEGDWAKAGLVSNQRQIGMYNRTKRDEQKWKLVPAGDDLYHMQLSSGPQAGAFLEAYDLPGVDLYARLNLQNAATKFKLIKDQNSGAYSIEVPGWAKHAAPYSCELKQPITFRSGSGSYWNLIPA